MRRSTYIAQAGVIAALYAVFTLVAVQFLGYLGWGPIQLRVSESLTVLALVTPAALPGLTIGTAVANGFMLTQVGPIGLLDMVFGSVATLIGVAWTWRMRERPVLALAGPVLSNAVIVPAYLPFILAGLGLYKIPVLGLDLEGSWPAMYAFGFVTVCIGQAVVVYGMGLPLSIAVRRSGLGRTLGAGVEGRAVGGGDE